MHFRKIKLCVKHSTFVMVWSKLKYWDQSFSQFEVVISGFLQLLWMLYCLSMILCLSCKINKVIKSFSFVLFYIYFYSLSTATVTMSIPILINLRSKKNSSTKELTPYIVREQLHHMHRVCSSHDTGMQGWPWVYLHLAGQTQT